VLCLSGRGDKDMDTYIQFLGDRDLAASLQERMTLIEKDRV